MARRSKFQLEKDRSETARLYLMGWRQVDIAERMGVSQQQISLDLKAVQAEWLASSVRDFDEARAQELAKVDQLEMTYWQTWERSLEAFKSKTVKAKGIKQDVGTYKDAEQTTRTEERNGDPRYLQGVQWCIDRRCKLLGLDAPQEHNVKYEDAGLTDAERANKILALLDRARERRDGPAAEATA